MAGNRLRCLSCGADILLEREQDKLTTEQPMILLCRMVIRSGGRGGGHPTGRRARKASQRTWYFIGSKGLTQAEETANGQTLKVNSHAMPKKWSGGQRGRVGQGTADRGAGRGVARQARARCWQAH